MAEVTNLEKITRIVNANTEIQILKELMHAPDKLMAKEAMFELARRVKWVNVPKSLITGKYSNKYDYFDPNMKYYVCSYGGAGSTMLCEYLNHFGTTYHIHSRNPPQKLTEVGKKKDDDGNSVGSVVWFNDTVIPDSELHNYKIIYIYRNPIESIFSRFITGPYKKINMNHLDNIEAAHWNMERIVANEMDLYKLEEFFYNYVNPNNRNYKIICLNYDKFWNNIETINDILNIPNLPEFYPVRKETEKQYPHLDVFTRIYGALIKKMDNMDPIYIS